MRTTLTLADDVVAAVERLRRERSIGLSEAVNELVRAGLVTHPASSAPFVQRTYDLGRAVNFDNIAETLEAADGPSFR